MEQVPARDRPRERLARHGPGALGDRELLALLLGTGGVPGSGAHELAERLLARFGSVAALSRATVAELASIKGVGSAKASCLVAGFELARRCDGAAPTRIAVTSDIAELAAPLLRGRDRERLLVITCDAGNRVIGTDIVSEGAADHALMPIREVLVAVLRRDGRRFALAHNHPSGNVSPSAQDVAATHALQHAARTAGVELLDHIVLTDTAWQRITAPR